MFKKYFSFLNLALALFALAVVITVYSILQSTSKSDKDQLAEINTATNQDIVREHNMGYENKEDGQEGSEETFYNSQLSAQEDDHVWGDKNSGVVMVVYDDFECPFCAKFYDTVEKLKKELNGRFAIIYRHNPLPFHLNAFPAAIASECASEQGRFWEMHDLLFADNKQSNLNADQYKKDAQSLGLDMAKFNNCLEENKYKEKVAQQMVIGKKLGVTGTPTFFVNRKIFPGAYPYEDFERNGKMEKGLKNIILEEIKGN